MKYLMLYLLVINVIAFVLMAVDKSRARRKRWRIPERRLFVPVFLGGGVGGILAMVLLRHKTRHKRFVLGFPLILGAQLVLLWGIVRLLS